LLSSAAGRGQGREYPSTVDSVAVTPLVASDLAMTPMEARHMIRFALVGWLSWTLIPPFASAQQVHESGAVMEVVERLFDAMRAGDSAAARSTFAADARLIATAGRDGPQLRVDAVDRFLEAIGTPHDQVWDERVWDTEVRIDGPLATVWTHYSFYLGDRLSHCGVDSFQMFRGSAGWKIVSVADTRRVEGCPEDAPESR
jgi:hypothetical protein